MQIKIEGLEELQARLLDNVTLDDVRKVVRHNGSKMTDKMKDNADFKMGYQTGETKRSISMELSPDGMTVEVGAKTEYAPYLETGTRFMDAQPFVLPAYEEQKPKFFSDMRKIMRK